MGSIAVLINECLSLDFYQLNRKYYNRFAMQFYLALLIANCSLGILYHK